MSATEPTPAQGFGALVELIARLRGPGGCPWDREQTHESLKPNALEEAYEVVEAIDADDAAQLAAELGDLLLQVVFHAQIAAEAGRFTIAEVIGSVADKMVRRHPHVFGSDPASTPGEVLRNWEALKEAERPSDSMLDAVSARLPAVMEAYQLTTKAARVGFDWPDVPGVLGKLEEEVEELRRAAARPEAEHRELTEEVGDLLLSAINVARKLGVDPESALKATNRKFRRRFRHIEEGLRLRGRKPADSSLDEMEALWTEAKSLEE